MIRIYGDASGRIIRVAQTDDPAELFVMVPDAVSTLILDPSTNAALAADYQARPESYTLLSGKIYKDGQLVTVNAPGADTSDAYNQAIKPETIAATIDTLTNGINQWDGLTAAQKQTVIVNNFKLVMQILRGVLRVVLWLYR
jgi:hypothetical protein